MFCCCCFNFCISLKDLFIIFYYYKRYIDILLKYDNKKVNSNKRSVLQDCSGEAHPKMIL